MPPDSPDLDIPLALWFYEEFIDRPHQQKRAIRQAYGFSEGRPGSSEDWELFAAILLKSSKNTETRYGHDLAAAEVKSARAGSSFEYQYHLNTGVAKLDAEHTVDHVFVSYEGGSVTVRLVSGEALRPIFESWREALLSNYEASNPNRRQRFRKNIPYGVVVREGQVLLSLENGQLIQPQAPTPQEQAQARARGEALLGPPAPDPASE
ncbi:hypothetical protein [Deinococcus sp.]|uniref:hypothetical protein n=1 Tax=Deinococcus sp. TaxID=47478 RepID=UPI003B5CB1B6